MTGVDGKSCKQAQRLECRRARCLACHFRIALSDGGGILDK